MKKATHEKLNIHRAGFTLVEMLLVVAITLILMSVSFIAIGVIRRDLRQKELDSKATVIYTAAQLRISELRTAGYEDRYQSSASGVEALGCVPSDASGDPDTKRVPLYYVTDSGKSEPSDAAYAILPEKSVSDELWEHYWIIEYEPQSGRVYAVFYSETANALQTYRDQLDFYRDRDTRLNAGARIGYYGGGDELPTEAEPEQPSNDGITVSNGEELIFDFKVPKHGDHVLRFEFEVSAVGSDGKKYVLDLNNLDYIFYSGNSDKIPQEEKNAQKYIPADFAEKGTMADYNADHDYYVFKWTMDTLRDETLRIYQQTNWELPLGTPLTLKLTVTCLEKDKEPLVYETTTNSLFADPPEGAQDKNTVYISKGRHLQNLDHNSKVTYKPFSANTEHVVQVADIFLGEGSEWAEVFGEKEFTPIFNGNIHSYTGSYISNGTKIRTSINGLHMNTGSDAGLFGYTSSDLTFTDVTLKDADIHGSNLAGAFVTQCGGTLTISGCQVYNTKEQAGKLTYHISGEKAGGFAGVTSTLIVKDSFVATSIEGNAYAGGMAAEASGKVDISNSYASVYLKAQTTAGLLPCYNTYNGGTVYAENFYATGYQEATNMAYASVVTKNTNPKLKNGYTAFDYTNNVKTSNANGENVFDFSGYVGSGLSADAVAQKLGTAFCLQEGDLTAHPYNLCDQGYTGEYPYPRLASFEHYGDWAQPKKLGKVGVFYWEYEEKSAHSGYHFSVVYTDKDNQIHRESNLCTEHDDGGYITSYGYGFFSDNDTPVTMGYNATEGYWVLGDENWNARNAFYKFMPKTNAAAYTTGSMYLKDENHYAPGQEGFTSERWVLTCGSGDSAAKFYYRICPFFANAISLEWTNMQAIDCSQERVTGSKENPFEIRSVTQLQYINWNFGEKKVDRAITSNDQYNQSDFNKYYFLTRDANGTSLASKSYWVQTHDVDMEKEMGDTATFTPIGGIFDNNDIYNPALLTAYFAGSYDGGSYQIRNINIDSTAQAIGIFGVTGGAELKNIVLYSDEDSVIKNQADGSGNYYLGSLVGLAAANGSESTIQNCASAGYRIVDNHEKKAWGKVSGHVGGLIGATNVIVANCSAVNTIELDVGNANPTEDLYAGGLIGASASTVKNCYTGGAITASPKQNQEGNTTKIWVRGIVGGAELPNGKTFATFMLGKDAQASYGSLALENCYTYTVLPEKSNATYVAGVSCFAPSGSTTTDCYAYAPSVHNAEDAKNALSYEDMCKLQEKLGNAFDTAKQSYPRKNYPFPAVIKNAKGEFVHYGDWAEPPLSVSTSALFLDLYAQDASTHIVKLYAQEGIKPTITYLNEAKGALPNGEFGVASATVQDYQDGYYPICVSAKSVGTGILRVYQIVGGQELTVDIAVSVTAQLKLSSLTSTAGVYGETPTGQSFAIVDANGNPLDFVDDPSFANSVTFSVSVSDPTLIDADAITPNYDADINCLTVHLPDHAERECIVTITMRYPYPSANGDTYGEATAQIIVPAGTEE